ncbi:MAG: FHA domain-containing protein [Pyrinomonadaceae bacterium]|nr:FHA domain-containing protein [Pyrinomonadaceae bacterium]
MLEVTLLIQNGQEAFEVRLEESLTIGRSDAATVMVNDDGLSRVHAGIYRKAELVWIVDQNSTHGSFVNNAEVPTEGTVLKDGDQIEIGNHTTVHVEMRERKMRAPARRATASRPARAVAQAKPSSFNFKSPVFIAAVSAALIIVLAIVAIVATRDVEEEKPQRQTRAPKPLIEPRIPDPLIDDWDVEEAPLPEEDQPTDETYRQALQKVKEERGEPTGYDAAVEIPAELKHYSDRRRNLAIQSAETIEQNIRIPHDFAELAQMIRAKQFVELKSVGESYVLYAVGGGATAGEFTHFDKEKGKSVPLYSAAAGMQAALNQMAETDERKAIITSFYSTGRGRSLAAAELESLTTLGRDLNKQTLDTNDAAARKVFKRRLLSFMRPEAQKVMEDLALAYKSRFNRPLPLASLVRTEEYQRELSERNVNAARNSLPPHTTGLAFDISYRYMNAAEQNFLMAEIARLEAAGRVEALRENNNCFHVFAFPDGRPPPESLIQKSM